MVQLFLVVEEDQFNVAYTEREIYLIELGGGVVGVVIMIMARGASIIGVRAISRQFVKDFLNQRFKQIQFVEFQEQDLDGGQVEVYFYLLCK